MSDPDFQLRPSEQPPDAPLRFAVLSDTHLSPAGTPDGAWNNVTRRSASASLLDTAVAQIVAAGHDRVLVLGDVSEFGTDDMIATALRTISDAGLRAWVVPGNHDVAVSSEAITRAAQMSANCVPLQTERHEQCQGVAVCGHGLRSQDGGQTCHAMDLPDLTPVHGRLLLWASHYPVLSQQARLRVAGLRYPGDLLNLAETRAAAERFHGPILVLHGHLHTAVVRHAGRILQIGSPAVVEWPHAWTDVSIQHTRETVAVRTALAAIPGQWSTGNVNSILDGYEQKWVFAAKRWQRPGTDRPPTSTPGAAGFPTRLETNVATTDTISTAGQMAAGAPAAPICSFDGPLNPAEPRQIIRIAWFGTSVMEHFEGYNAQLVNQAALPSIGSTIVVEGWHKRGYVQRLRLALQTCWPSLRFDWDNRGEGGATSRDILPIVGENTSTRHRRDLAFLGCGINDVWRGFQQRADQAVPIDEYADNYRAMTRLLTQTTRKLICLAETPFGWDTDLDVVAMNAELARYNAVAERIAREEHADFIDVWPAFAATARQLADGEPANPACPSAGTLWSDGVHLSELGDALLLRLVERHLDDHGVISALTAYERSERTRCGPGGSEPSRDER